MRMSVHQFQCFFSVLKIRRGLSLAWNVWRNVLSIPPFNLKFEHQSCTLLKEPSSIPHLLYLLISADILLFGIKRRPLIWDKAHQSNAILERLHWFYLVLNQLPCIGISNNPTVSSLTTSSWIMIIFCSTVGVVCFLLPLILILNDHLDYSHISIITFEPLMSYQEQILY